MADESLPTKRISELPPAATLTDGDLIPISSVKEDAFISHSSAVGLLKKFINERFERFSPPIPSMKLKGWSSVFTDISGRLAYFGSTKGGGFRIAGITHDVQTYLKHLVSSVVSDKIKSKYLHIEFAGSLKHVSRYVDNRLHTYFPYMNGRSLQEVIAELQENTGGTSDRLVRPDGNGNLALYPSSAAAAPLWNYAPVIAGQKITDTGIAFTFDDGDGVKSAVTPIAAVIGTERVRELEAAAREMHYLAGLGQSLRCGGGGVGLTQGADPELFGRCLMFSGAGRDRGATVPVDGDVTDERLGSLTDPYIIGSRNNCQVPAAQKILRMHRDAGIAKSAWPLIVTRLDGKPGTAYAGLKKGTQPYTDGMTTFDAFCRRAEGVGKIPICKVIGITHGEADSDSPNTLRGVYKGYLNEWINNQQADRMARSGQTETPWIDIDQMGSLTNRNSATGEFVAIDQWELTRERDDAFLSVSKWLLNRKGRKDKLHLLDKYYLVLGEYHGMAEYSVLYEKKGKWQTVQPVSAVMINETTAEITFTSPLGKALQEYYDAGIAPNLGCDLQNGSANVISAAQSGDFKFRFVTDKPPSVGDYFRFGFNAEDGAPLVNIADTSTEKSIYVSNFTLIQPCALSRILVPGVI